MERSKRKQVLSLKEAACEAGLSPWTFYKWSSEKRLPFKSIKAGSRVLIPRESFEFWLSGS